MTHTVRILAEPDDDPPVFPIVRDGYDPAAVDSFIEQLRRQLADRQWSAEELSARAADLERREAELSAHVANGIPSVAGLSAHLRAVAAHQEAELAERRAAAERDIRRAEIRAAEATGILETRLAAMRQRAADESHSIVATARIQAEQIVSAASEEARRRREEAQAELDSLREERERIVADLDALADRLVHAVHPATPPPLRPVDMQTA